CLCRRSCGISPRQSGLLLHRRRAPPSLRRRPEQQLPTGCSWGPLPVVLLARVRLGSGHRNAGPLRPLLGGQIERGAMTSTLNAPALLWQEIRDDLLSTPHLERAGIGFAGISHRGLDRHLLLRDWISVPASEYLVQLDSHL